MHQSRMAFITQAATARSAYSGPVMPALVYGAVRSIVTDAASFTSVAR